MAYTYLPPRTTNYFPPGMPYLAGLRGMHGLGDYAADLATYKHAMALYEGDYKKWIAEKKKYDAAMASYTAQCTAISVAYDNAVSQYGRDKADWNNEYAAYKLAVDSWNKNFAGYKSANTARAQTIAQSYGINLPQSFFDNGACVTQAQHNAYAASCTSVRGLGSSDPDCGWKAMPVCQFGPYPTLRAEPVVPPKPVYPKKPTLRAAPVPPLAPTPPPAAAPSSGGGGASAPGPALAPVTTTSPEPTAEQHKQANVVMGGLIAVALVGGGYLVYRTLKKPKAA